MTPSPAAVSQIRRIGAPMADYLARLSFDTTTQLMAEFYDLVNERRDDYIKRAHDTIEKILNEPNYPNDKWRKGIEDLNKVIKMMEGGK